MREFIESKGYKWYPHPIEKSNEFAEKNSYQKRVDSEAVCECNDRLFINILEYKWLQTIETERLSYQVEITAERKGKWWVLMSYSINDSELKTDLDDIEKTLIRLFNTI